MRIAFRTDASINIGNGHVLRCLTLADALRERGSTCLFVCRRDEGNLIDKIIRSGFEVVELNPRCTTKILADYPENAAEWEVDAHQTMVAIGSDIDWIVVDHYSLDARWESIFRNANIQLLVIDDTADRPHNADFLVDQNVGRKASDYRDLTPDGCKVLAGPQYALLRREFSMQRNYGLRPRNELRKLLVSMGGVDKANVTATVLSQLKSIKLPESTIIKVVMGPHAPHRDSVRELSWTMPWPTEVLIDVNDMANLMNGCDLAIGAAGVSALERCCVGLPSIIIPVADNQVPGAKAIAAGGGAKLLSINTNDTSQLSDTISQFLLGDALQVASGICASITDGKGAGLIADLMSRDSLPQLRRMQESDLDRVLAWRNTPEIRSCMTNPDEISPETHNEWFRRVRTDADREIMIAEASGEGFGFVQFSGLSARKAPEWGFYVAPGAPKGSGRTLGNLALEHAFRRLRLPRLIGHTLATNDASIRFHKKFGFRSICTRNPQSSSDLIAFELLREDWERSQGVNV